MQFLKKFTFPMKGELNHKSFEWVISEDKVLPRDEIVKLIKFCHKLKSKGIRKNRFCLVRDWFMVELGLFTGLRVEEMVELQVKDVLIDNSHASIIVRHGKGSRKRAVWINHVFKQSCSEFLKIREKFGLNNDEEQFLLTSQKGKPLTKRALQKRFKMCIQKANLPAHYSIHCLRHTYGTFLLRASGNLKMVKEQLGHASIKTTEVYISLIEEDTKQALKNLYKGKI